MDHRGLARPDPLARVVKGKFMPVSWKRRLAVVLSCAWVVLWLLAYLIDPFKDFRAVLVGMLAFGLAPVAFYWLGVWVWAGYRESKALGQRRR